MRNRRGGVARTPGGSAAEGDAAPCDTASASARAALPRPLPSPCSDRGAVGVELEDLATAALAEGADDDPARPAREDLVAGLMGMPAHDEARVGRAHEGVHGPGPDGTLLGQLERLRALGAPAKPPRNGARDEERHQPRRARARRPSATPSGGVDSRGRGCTDHPRARRPRGRRRRAADEALEMDRLRRTPPRRRRP